MSRFVTGGPVRHDSPFYVTRAIEDEAFRVVRGGQYLTVLGPRQMGKTSLLQKIQTVVERQYEFASALVDLSPLNDAQTDRRTWSTRFCDRLLEQLRQFVRPSFAATVPEDALAFRRYWVELARHIERPRILLLLDEASSVPQQIRDTFYSTVREMFNERTAARSSPELNRFNFVFAGMFEPERLIRDRHNSPFNVSEVVRLPDFTREEVERLISEQAPEGREALPVTAAEAIYGWTGGHPYLTQVLAEVVSWRRHTRPTESVTAEVIAEEAEGLFDKASANIDPVIQRALEKEEQVEILRQILQGKRIPFVREKYGIPALDLCGAIRRGADGQCEIRNRIYRLALCRALDLPGQSSTAMTLTRDRVFIVYARDDKDPWLERVQKHLALLQLENRIAIWSDEDIEPSQLWEREISASLDRARAAVLLVSTSFLGSRFIREHELPPLLEQAESGEVEIIPIVLEPCLLETTFRFPDPGKGPKAASLSQFQTIGSEDRPLSEMDPNEQKRELMKVTRRLRKSLDGAEGREEDLSGDV